MLKKREGSREKERPNMRQNDSMQKAIAMCLQELGRVFEDRILEHHSFRESPRVEANSHFLYPISKKKLVYFTRTWRFEIKLCLLSCLPLLSLPSKQYTYTHNPHRHIHLLCLFFQTGFKISLYTWGSILKSCRLLLESQIKLYVLRLSENRQCW